MRTEEWANHWYETDGCRDEEPFDEQGAESNKEQFLFLLERVKKACEEFDQAYSNKRAKTEVYDLMEEYFTEKKGELR